MSIRWLSETLVLSLLLPWTSQRPSSQCSSPTSRTSLMGCSRLLLKRWSRMSIILLPMKNSGTPFVRLLRRHPRQVMVRLHSVNIQAAWMAFTCRIVKALYPTVMTVLLEVGRTNIPLAIQARRPWTGCCRRILTTLVRLRRRGGRALSCSWKSTIRTFLHRSMVKTVWVLPQAYQSISSADSSKFDAACMWIITIMACSNGLLRHIQRCVIMNSF